MTILEGITLGAEALEAIAKLIAQRGNKEAAAILDGIGTVIGAVANADIHTVTAEEASRQMDMAVAELVGNDAAADAALDAKFPTGEGE